MKKKSSDKSGFTQTRAVFAILFSISAVSLAIFSFVGVAAPNPSSGTLSPTNPEITYTDTLVENTTGVVGAPICVAPNTCSDFTLTVNAASVAATKQIFIEGTWTPAQNDFDIYIENTSGQVIAQNPSTANPSVIILPIPAAGTVYHIFILASVGAGNLEAVVKLIDKTTPVNQPPGAPPRYMNYPAGTNQANDSGEPSIGVDWNPNVVGLKHDLVNTGGMAFFTSNFNQWQASFDDCSSPALNLWTDVTDPNEQITSLDPIGFTDHYTTAQLGLSYPPPHTPGRTFQAQLAAGDSIMVYTDDDGATHSPSQGGGAPAGPDHQTVGGGPFHSPVPTPPAPAYPNAIYYCSQSLTEAECSRSDDGGITFGAGVPIYNPTVCLGGIHGHVKVSPQGTAYVPNSSCFVGTGNNGAAVSKDNGITWNQVVVPGSTGSQDPSIAIGQNNVGKPSGQVPNTVYLGWVSADGHAHVAHSPNEGTTWQDDIDVGSILGVQEAAFPACVAGDDNRAACGFLGTTTAGIAAYSDDLSFHGIWHLYIATTYDGGHNWILMDATPNDPVQTGAICLKGPACSGPNPGDPDSRNLLDFNDFTVDAQGRGLYGYADGCVNCLNTYLSQSSAAKGTIARQSGGRRLFAAFDPVEPAPPAAPQVLSAVRVSGPPAGVLVSWLTPDNGGSPITGYNVYRGTSSGSETLLASVSGVDTNKYLDQTANSSTNYYYRVTALNTINNATVESPFCREVNINGTAAGATACAAPYIQVAGAGSPGPVVPSDPTPGGELTIQHLNIGEPFTSCSDNSITFTMKVNTLDPQNTGQLVLPENSEWQVLFGIKDTSNNAQTAFVALDTVPPHSTALPGVVMGRHDPRTGGGTIDTTLCGAPSQTACPNLTATASRDGTITYKLNTGSVIHFNAPSAAGIGVAFDWDPRNVGTTLTSTAGNTWIFVGAAGTGALELVQTTTGNPYTRIGNVSGCNTINPIAILSGTPLSGPPGMTVSFDGRGSNEPFGACGTINSYTLDFGDGSPTATNSTGTFSHPYNTVGTYPAKLTVADSIGHTSTNLAQVVITVEQNMVLVGAVSRMTHGSAGTFDLNLPLTGTRGVECRSSSSLGAGNYTMVFQFNNSVTSVAGATVTGTGAVSSRTVGFNDHEYVVNLTGVANKQYISVNLTGVNGSLSVTGPQMGVLIGDVNASGIVTSGDTNLSKAQALQPVSSANARDDINASGAITTGDVNIIKQNALSQLPTPP